MYVAEIPNRTSPPAILLRESFREDGKVKNRTIANITSWPRLRVEAFRRLLRGADLWVHARPQTSGRRHRSFLRPRKVRTRQTRLVPGPGPHRPSRFAFVGRSLGSRSRRR